MQQTRLESIQWNSANAFEINAQLHNVAVIHRVRAAFDARGRQSDVVQKSARARFDVLDVPLSFCAPKFAMSPAYDFGLEADWQGIRIPSMIVPLAISPDSYNTRFDVLCTETPRILLPLCGLPLLAWTLESLSFSRVKQVFVFCGTWRHKTTDKRHCTGGICATTSPSPNPNGGALGDWA